MSFAKSTSPQTLYRSLLIESGDLGKNSLSPVLAHSRFLVERCATAVEAVHRFRDHDLVLIRAARGMQGENLRHLISWLRHNSVEGSEPYIMIVAGERLLAELKGLPCDMVDERNMDSTINEHLKEVRDHLDTARKNGDSSFWSRLFGRSQAADEPKDLHQPVQTSERAATSKEAETSVKTRAGQPMNSAREEAAHKPRVPAADIQPVAPLVPREKVAALQSVPREVIAFRRPVDISLIAPILLKEISEAAVVLGQDYRVIDANEAWLNLFSCEKGSVLGSAGVEFKTGFDKVAWANILHRALLGRDFNADKDALDPPLQSLKVRPIPGKEGTPVGVLILCTSAPPTGESKSPQTSESATEIEERVRAELQADLGRQKIRINEMATELAALREGIRKVEAEAKFKQEELGKEREAAIAAQQKHELQRTRFNELMDALASARSIGREPQADKSDLLAKLGAQRIDLSLLDHAPFGLVRLSSDGEVMFANKQVDALMGFSIKTGQSFSEWIAKGRASDETSAALVAEWTDKVWRRQMTFVAQVAGDDGLLKDVEFRPTLMDDGGLLVFVTDVTDRQQVYDALRTAEAKFRGIFRSTVAGVALMDRDSAIYDANAMFCQLFALERSEVCSATLSALVARYTADHPAVEPLPNPHSLTLPGGKQAVLVWSEASGADENELRAIYCVPVPRTKSSPDAVAGDSARESVLTMVKLIDEWSQLTLGFSENTRYDTLLRWFDVLNSVIATERHGQVDIAKVVRDLVVENSRRMDAEARARISFDAPVDERPIPRETAIPLALAISELLKNAVQHGLKNGAAEGLIRVHFTRSEHEIVVEICDTGAELRQDFEFEKHAGEGLEFVRLLAAQLRGKVSIVSGSETRCQLNIPLN